MNVQLSDPVELVVKEPPAAQLVIVTPSNTRDDSAVDTEKPVPKTTTVAPTGPWEGDTVIAGVVTVKVCIAVDTPVAKSCPTTL